MEFENCARGPDTIPVCDSHHPQFMGVGRLYCLLRSCSICPIVSEGASRGVLGRRKSWGIFAGLVALEAAITAVLCWLALPDFAAVDRYRIDTVGASAITHVFADGQGPMQLYLPTYGGDLSVSLNGKPVLLATHDDEQLTRSRHFATADIAGQQLQGAADTLRLAQRNNFQNVPLSPVYFGPASQIAPVVHQHRNYGWWMQQLIPIAGIITVILSTLLIFFSRSPLKYFYLIVAFALQTLIELNLDIGLFGMPLSAFGMLLGTLVNLAIAFSIATWTQASLWQRRAVIWSGTGMLAIHAAAIIGGQNFNDMVVVPVKAIYGGWLILITLNSWAMILRAKFRSSILQMGTLAAIALAFSGLMSFVLISNERFSLPTTYFVSNWVNVATSMGVIIFIFGALANEVSLYRAQRHKFGLLESIVAGHHVDMEEQAHSLHEQIEKTAVLEERERFVRDMHDGVGSQLLTLLLKVRNNGDLAPGIAADVQGIIGDLRMVTSALDQSEGNLTQTLDRLHHELEAQTSAAGITLHWQVGDDVPVQLDPRQVLEVMRIMQEAVANAVRHAGASIVAVSITQNPALLISIADDGCGFDPDTVKRGKGLRNMAGRAKLLGGELSYGPGLEGLGAGLMIKLPPAA